MDVWPRGYLSAGHMCALSAQILRPKTNRKINRAFSRARQYLHYRRQAFDYGAQRLLTTGLLRETVVVIAHTEEKQELRINSMRKGTRNEQTIYFEAI